jgi:hypothetical protein
MTLSTVVQNSLTALQADPQIAQLFTIVNSLGTVLILGSAVREWYYGESPANINIVIDCPASSLYVFSTYDGVQLNQNNVTGYQFSISGTQFTIWNLDATWAIIQSNTFAQEASLNILPQTVFFNLDAVGYRLDTGTIVDAGFAATIASNQLDIVFEPNLFPMEIAQQALSLISQYNLQASLRLLAYIRRYTGAPYFYLE